MKRLIALCLATLFLAAQANAVDPAPYGRLPAMGNLSLSPSGKRYAFIGMVGEKRMLVAVDADANKALYAADVGDIKIRSIQWAGENNLVAMVTKTENLMADFGAVMELASVLRINLKDKSIGAIFKDVPSVAPRVFGMYGTAVIDGKGYGYFGGITLETQTGARAAYRMPAIPMVDLYKVELDTGKTRIQAEGMRQNDSNWHVSPEGKIVATSLYDERTSAWRLHPGEARNKSLMEKTSALHQIGLIGQGRTPGTVLVLDQTNRESDRLLEVKLSDGSSEELFKNVGILEYLHDPDTGLLIGARTTGRDSASFFDAALEKRWNLILKTFPGRRAMFASASHNLERVILKTEAGKDSGTFWLVDTVAGKASPLGSSYPAIRPPQVGEASLITYKAEDGLEIAAVLTMSPGDKKTNLPMIMMPHGGPIGVHDEVSFDWWAQAFAANGYAVLQPNYRGSSGSTISFEEAGYGEWGKKMLSDMKDGITALAQKGVIDPKRVCIVGGSYGGYAAMAGITIQQGLYKCSVSLAGVSDVRSFHAWWNDRHGTVNEGFRFYRKALGIDKGGERVLDEISPIQFAKRADAPLLLIHGKGDTVVPIAQSGMMQSALESAGKPVELIRMEGEDHWLSHEATRMTLVKESVAFVLKHNPPDQATPAN